MNIKSYLILEIGEKQFDDCREIFSLSGLNFHKKLQIYKKKIEFWYIQSYRTIIN